MKTHIQPSVIQLIEQKCDVRLVLLPAYIKVKSLTIVIVIIAVIAVTLI